MTTTQAIEQADLISFFLKEDHEDTGSPDHDYGYYRDPITGECHYCADTHEL